MSEILDKVRRHHESRKPPYGGACTWHSDHQVLECECGRLIFYLDQESACQCGNDHVSFVRELAGCDSKKSFAPWYDSCPWLHEG